MPHPRTPPGDPERPSHPELPEFDDVHQDGEGVWRAVHASGTEISGEYWDVLVARAVAVRIFESWRRVWASEHPE